MMYDGLFLQFYMSASTCSVCVCAVLSQLISPAGARDALHRICHRIIESFPSPHSVSSSASKSSIRRFVITEKAPTMAFSWLKAATTAFTFKTLLRHYAKQALTPRSFNVKLGPRHKGFKGRAGWLA